MSEGGGGGGAGGFSLRQKTKERRYTFEPNELLEILSGKKLGIKSEVKDNMLLLRGSDRKKYLQAMEYLGYDITEVKAIRNIKIDRKGFSREVGEKLGEGYVVDKIIIVNEKQRDLGLVDNQFSFMPSLLDRVYEDNKRLIGMIAPVEALVTDFNVKFDLIYNTNRGHSQEVIRYLNKITNNRNWLELNSFFQEESQKVGFAVSLKSETPTEAIKMINNLKDKIDHISDRDILDEEWMNNSLDEVFSVNKKYGNIKEIKELINILEYPIGSFRFKNSDLELYAIDHNSNKSQSVKKDPLLIYFGRRIESNLNEIICAEDKDKIYDALLNRKYLSWNKQKGIAVMEEVEADIMRGLGYVKEKNFDEVRDNGLKALNELDYFRLLQDSRAIRKLGKEWFELRDIIYNEEDFSKLSLSMKLIGTSLDTKDKYVAEIYAKINPDDLLLNYMHNEDDFNELFDKADIERKKTTLTKILTLDNKQLNLNNTKWLLDNHRDLLNEVKLYDKIKTAIKNYSNPEVKKAPNQKEDGVLEKDVQEQDSKSGRYGNGETIGSW